MDKQRNRDNRRQKQKLNSRKSRRTTPQTAPSQSKNDPVVKRESSNESDDDMVDIFDYVGQKLAQPKSRYANIQEADIKSTNDFEDLKNSSVSCSYFQFKSEKNWTEDISKYSEFLAIDIRKLETIVDCIPYYQLVEVDDSYFTKDQLTHYNSRAEQSEKLYESELLEKEQLKKQDYQNDDIFITTNKNSKVSEADQSDDDLDYLLSLKEPEPIKPALVTSSFSLSKNNKEPKVPKYPLGTDSIDFDNFLDAVLDMDI